MEIAQVVQNLDGLWVELYCPKCGRYTGGEECKNKHSDSSQNKYCQCCGARIREELK